ncbi:type III-D CRISPR-associated protein Csx19 [Micromonospora sp. SH-82]|uniref:type III-D CRISPR-associated protein Csx19 n=1 Tax=Micromonospora sp. SH-82 TaxID=3132938 RepID=UPI003EBAA94B
MNTVHEDAALNAVRAVPDLTASDAVAWFVPGTPSGRQVIGYTLSARAATWLRVSPAGVVEAAPGTGDILTEAYEMVLFDGERELRWLRSPDGTGPAIALGEDPAHLPSGRDVTTDPPPRRGETHTRLLAGNPDAHAVAGWSTLGSERYAAAQLPTTFTGGEVLTIETVEYLVEDGHGNVDVVDSRTVALRSTTKAAVSAVAATMTGQEGTAA